MTDDELRRHYAASRRGAPAPPERASLDEMQQLVEGGLPAGRREALLEQVLADPAATRELAMLHAVASARPRQRRWTATRWATLAAAAAVVLAVTPFVMRNTDPEPVYRAGDPAGTGIEVLAPADRAPLAAGARLAWRPVPDADRYVVEIVSSAGDAIASLTTRDTLLVLPDSISTARLAAASGWMVVAHLRDGGQRQSSMRVTTARTP